VLLFVDPLERVAGKHVSADLREVAVHRDVNPVDRAHAKMMTASRTDPQISCKVPPVQNLRALRTLAPGGSVFGLLVFGAAARQPVRHRSTRKYPAGVKPAQLLQ